jgi:hypothetical protein
MTTATRFPSAVDRPPEKDPGALVDWEAVRDHLGFAVRSVRRRPLLAIVCFVAIASLGPVSLEVMPRSYRVEAVVAAARNPVVSTLPDPMLRRAFEAEDPASTAHDAILRRDNLLALCEETGLLDRWLRLRAPAVRLRDRILEVVAGAPTREERLEALVDRLEKKLEVEIPGAQPGAPPGAPRDKVRIAVEWPDPEAAKLIVDVAVRRFLDGRRAHEVSIFRDAVGTLEMRAAGLQREVDAKVASVQKLEMSFLRANPGLSRTLRARAARVPQEDELARLRTNLESRRLALADLERVRTQRAEELRGELARQRATYADQHPVVARTRELLERLSAPSAEAEALRGEIAGLEQDVRMASERVSRLVDDEDPALEYQRTELRFLLAQYSAIRDRLEGVRVEMETAGSAFDRRYGFAMPPILPRKPVWPIPVLSLAAAVLGGVLLALFVTATLDLRSGRILERWQIERTLGVPSWARSRRDAGGGEPAGPRGGRRRARADPGGARGRRRDGAAVPLWGTGGSGGAGPDRGGVVGVSRAPLRAPAGSSPCSCSPSTTPTTRTASALAVRRPGRSPAAEPARPSSPGAPSRSPASRSRSPSSSRSPSGGAGAASAIPPTSPRPPRPRGGDRVRRGARLAIAARPRRQRGDGGLADAPLLVTVALFVLFELALRGPPITARSGASWSRPRRRAPSSRCGSAGSPRRGPLGSPPITATRCSSRSPS